MQLFGLCAIVLAGLLVGEAFGENCAAPGALCKRKNGEEKCDCANVMATTCKQWKGRGNFYCQLNADIKGGEFCHKRRGTCREGLTCQALGGGQGRVCKGCPNPGDICKNKNPTIGEICSSCPTGTECTPWIGTNGKVGHSYCQKITRLGLGEDCANRVGTCAEDLECTALGGGLGRECKAKPAK